MVVIIHLYGIMDGYRKVLIQNIFRINNNDKCNIKVVRFE